MQVTVNRANKFRQSIERNNNRVVKSEEDLDNICVAMGHLRTIRGVIGQANRLHGIDAINDKIAHLESVQRTRKSFEKTAANRKALDEIRLELEDLYEQRKDKNIKNKVILPDDLVDYLRDEDLLN